MSVVCVCKYEVGKSGGMQLQRNLGDCFWDHSLSPNVETIKRSYLELLSSRHGTRDRFVPHSALVLCAVSKRNIDAAIWWKPTRFSWCGLKPQGRPWEGFVKTLNEELFFACNLLSTNFSLPQTQSWTDSPFASRHWLVLFPSRIQHKVVWAWD